MLTKTALKKLDYALALINESRKFINDITELLNKKPVVQPLSPRQGELFLNTPVYDEKLSRLCLGTLAETITDFSDIGNSRPVGADKKICVRSESV